MLGKNFFRHKKYLVNKKNKKEKKETNKNRKKRFCQDIFKKSRGKAAFAFHCHNAPVKEK
jgi:superoxide dismutase